MTDLHLSHNSYRVADATTKLAGVGLIGAALEVGIVSILGIALATAGTLLGSSTVFLTEDTQ